jgi:hypothetical protein
MDIEFHYYLNYIIARECGYSNEQAYNIALASQLLDDQDLEINYASKNITIFKTQVSHIFYDDLSLAKLLLSIISCLVISMVSRH